MNTSTSVPRAGDFMNRKVETVQQNQSLADVTNFLLTHKLSNVPVVDKTDGPSPKLLGFISEQDCLEHLSNELFHGRTEQAQTARMIMKRHPVCIDADTDLFTLASIFVDHGYRHLPVVEGEQLLGIVSRRDILKAIDAHYRASFLKQQSEHFPPDRSMFENLRFHLGVK